MAIVKMKKLRAIAAASQKELLLRELLLLGCVELREQDALLGDPQSKALLSPMYGDVNAARAERQLFASAVQILDQHVPVKTPLLSPKPELCRHDLLDESRAAELLPAAENLLKYAERLRELDTEESRLKLTAESFAPWKDCQVALDYSGTKHVAAQLGTLPARTDMDALAAELADLTGAAELLEISADENARYLLLLCHRSEKEQVTALLRGWGFAPPAFGAATGYAANRIANAEQRMSALGTERIELEARIADLARYREEFRMGFDRAGTKVDCAEEESKLLASAKAILLEGWAVAEREAEISELLERLDCAYEFTEPAEEEYPDVPVQLKNNPLTDGLNMVTNMYSLPRYGSVDPNPLMAPFFILFYGIMMADMGYGLIMLLGGLLIMWKKRPQEGFMRYFGELLIEGGIATFLMGILTGGFFGDALKWLVQLINPASTWQGFPAIIDPLNDTVTVLIGAIILGFIHLNAGMVIAFVMKVRRGQLLDALCSEGSMWVLFLGVALTVLGLGGKAGLIIGLVAYVLGKVIPAKGIAGRLLAVFSGLYNDLTGWFGDLLSYARLMALMLAGSVIAQVFNTLGAMPGSLIAFIPICLLGNALNLGLNLLGCYVHDLRLQCLEFFNKFYEAGGRAFRPLAVRSKYYNITK